MHLLLLLMTVLMAKLVDENQLCQDDTTLNVGKSCFSFSPEFQMLALTYVEIHVSKGSLSRPEDRYVRFLGILLDENLFFKHHIDLIKMKVSWSLGMYRKLKHIFPGSILIILFCSLVQSYVSHCSVGCQLFPRL